MNSAPLIGFSFAGREWRLVSTSALTCVLPYPLIMCRLSGYCMGARVWSRDRPALNTFVVVGVRPWMRFLQLLRIQLLSSLKKPSQTYAHHIRHGYLPGNIKTPRKSSNSFV